MTATTPITTYRVVARRDCLALCCLCLPFETASIVGAAGCSRARSRDAACSCAAFDWTLSVSGSLVATVMVLGVLGRLQSTTHRTFFQLLALIRPLHLSWLLKEQSSMVKHIYLSINHR